MTVALAAAVADVPDIPIADVRARLLRAPLPEPISMSFSRLDSRSMVLVEVEADNGLVGYGESWVNYPAWAGTERFATLQDGALPLVLGQDGANVRGLHQRLKQHLVPLGSQWGAPGPIMQAISGVDIALWDLLAKQLRVPLSVLFGGGARSTVQVYASSLGPHRVVEMAQQCRDEGFRGVKLKVGFGHQIDRDNVENARRTLGPDVRLMVDANQGWTLAEAVEMAPVLLDCGVAWVEEPLRGNRLPDLERLHEATGIRIATGENLYGLDSFLDYMRSPAVHVIQPDVAKVGGLTETMAICQLAAATGKAVIPHVYAGAISLLATLQLAAAFPEITQIEYDVRSNPLRDPLLTDPPVLIDGALTIPSALGLGAQLDDQVVNRYEVS